MPLRSQVPASEPISSKIMMEDIAELILLTIPDLISRQLNPSRNATRLATAADSMRIIWFEPSSEASPNIRTLMNKATIKNRIGINA